MSVVHVTADRLDGGTFCGLAFMLDSVDAQAWRAEPETVQRSTCPECLLRLFMLGDSAQIALGRMGMKVDVHNATPGVEQPS